MHLLISAMHLLLLLHELSLLSLLCTTVVLVHAFTLLQLQKKSADTLQTVERNMPSFLCQVNVNALVYARCRDKVHS